MHPLVAPDLAAFSEQAEIGRLAEGCPPAKPHQMIADPIIDRDVVEGEARAGHHLFQFHAEFGSHMLVGIDLDDPLALAGGDASIAARPFQFPGAFDQPVGEALGDLFGAVGAFIQHHYDLVGETELFQTGGETALFIMSHDKSRESHWRSSIQRTAAGRSSTMASGQASPAFSASAPHPVRTRMVVAPMARPRSISTF